jgi:hypothetical protein
MIRHIWSVLCSKGSVDQQTNAVSLFEVIEELQLRIAPDAEFPMVAPLPVLLVSYWSRVDREVPLQGEQRLRLISPGGEELGSFVGDIDLESAGRSRSFARFPGNRLGGAGRHEWEVAWRIKGEEDWNVAASIPFDLTVSYEDEDKGGNV